jgi:hypothetical protein
MSIMMDIWFHFSLNLVDTTFHSSNKKILRFITKDLDVQDNGIGNIMYALLQFHFKITLSINYVIYK